MKRKTITLKCSSWLWPVFLFTGFTCYAQEKISTLEEELEQVGNISLLPQYRDDTRVAMLSSYDTTGGNDDGFSGRFSYIRKEGEGRLVIADLKGPGVIQRIWTPTPSADTLHFYFDGESQPRITLKFEDLFSGKVFPFQAPLAGNEVGGYYCYVPIPYEKSCKVVYVGESLMFHQIQYREYPETKQVNSFSMDLDAREIRALEEASSVWRTGGTSFQELVQGSQEEVKIIRQDISIGPGEITKVAEIGEGGRIIGLLMDHAGMTEEQEADLILRARWNREPHLAIHAPVSHFFGNGFGDRAMSSMLLGSTGETNYCYFPMPFDREALLEVQYLVREGADQPGLNFQATVYYTDEERKPDREGRFYATWRREQPATGVPYNILKQEGKGHHVGTILYCQNMETEDVSISTGYFEGDDITTIDGEMRMHGTGSEDYFNGGWYAVSDRWDDGHSLPSHGCLDYSIALGRTGGYRLYMGDKVSFNKLYELTIEHGPVNNDWEVDYGSMAFYYGEEAPLNGMQPTPDLTRKFETQGYLEVYLNHFDIHSFGFPFSPASIHYERMNGRTVFRFHGEADWTYIKTFLEIPAESTYDLFISYYKLPESGQLRLMQRQKPVTDWMDISSEQMEFVERQYMGRITVNQERTPLTLQTRGERGRCDFALHMLYLKEVNE